MSTPKPLSVPNGERPWLHAYRRYRELEKELSDGHQWGWLNLLQNSVQGPSNFESHLAKYISAQDRNGNKLPEPPASLLDELRALADLWSSYDPEPADFVFEDVYHLAFHKLYRWRGYQGKIPPASERPHLFRGHKEDIWHIDAPLYRNLPVGPERALEVQKRAVSACQMGHAMAVHLGLSFMDAMAVVQHFAGKDYLNIPTWLADFTRDEWVALFFASDGGENGKYGIVWEMSLTEYATITAGEDNPIGPLQLVVPPGVQRIENQAGVFVLAGLPQIFDQYVPRGWDHRFRQYSGLRFEDPVLGITADTIYPPNDPIKLVLSDVKAGIKDCGCGPSGRPCEIPPTVFTDPFAASTYERLLNCWLDEYTAVHLGDPDPTDVRAALADLARFHARLQSPEFASRLPDMLSRSLNRLREAFESLYFMASEGLPVSAANAIRDTYIAAMSDDAEHERVLEEALQS
jgi:hypothetical protein